MKIERPSLGFTFGELKEEVKKLAEHVDDNEPVVVIIDDDVEHLDELESGSVLDITEVGGYIAGMRTIRVRPR